MWNLILEKVSNIRKVDLQVVTEPHHCFKKIKICVIIPALNESQNIGFVVEEVKKALPLSTVLVIDDGSDDNTSVIAKEFGALVIRLGSNLGIGAAVQTGFKYAQANNFDIAVQLDADGQHDPFYIKELVKPILEKKADVAIGSRFIENNGYRSTFSRRIGIKWFSTLTKLLMKKKILDCTSGFRAYNQRAIHFLYDRYPDDYPEPESLFMLDKNGFGISEVPVVMRERKGGISSINSLKSIYYIIKVTLASTMWSIRKVVNG